MGIPSQMGACSPPRSHRSARQGRDPAPGAGGRRLCSRAVNYAVAESEWFDIANTSLYLYMEVKKCSEEWIRVNNL